MSHIKKVIQSLSHFELCLWLCSVSIVSASFFLFAPDNILTLIASLIGVTALIFVAKGYVIGQILTVVFSVFYGIISFGFRYYGEMITYLGMTSPIAILSVISWLRHPFQNSAEVEVNRLSKRQLLLLSFLTILVTGVFYFILRHLGNANLLPSTISVATSFIASYCTLCRSPFYALGYAANDIVLILLWVLAAGADLSCLPMILCFVVFLFNDLYGFFHWQKMKRQQKQTIEKDKAST